MLPESVDRPSVLHSECLELMRQLPSGCVNLIVADPPYFKVKGEAWDWQWKKPAQFLAWLGEIVDEWRRILAPNGSLYCFASPKMAARVECLIDERLEVLNAITWAKPDPFSTINRGAGNGGRTCKETLRAYYPNTERIIFAEQRGADSMAMGESGYEAQCERLRRFVFEPLRAYICDEFERAGMLTAEGKIAANVACGFSASAGGMASRHYFSRSQWQLPTAEHYAALRRLLGPEYLRREYETLREQYETLREEYEALRRPFTVSAEVPYTDVWTFPTVQHYKGKHPCEKPRAMMDHIIAASSRPGDVVLDPFLGSGVAGEAAVALGRRFIGMEMGDYVHAARERIDRAVQALASC